MITEDLEKGLSDAASQIEGRVKKELAPYVWDAEKNVVVKSSLEGWDYTFVLYVGGKWQGVSVSKPTSEFPPDIDQAVELLVLDFNIQRGVKNRQTIKEKEYSDHQLIMMALARLLYRTDDINGEDASLACALYERI